MFALVDVNSFYASCETIFRPDLRGRPVIVLSNNDGCVIARSAEAKALGVPMGGMSEGLSLRTAPTAGDTGCQTKSSACRLYTSACI